MDHIHLQRNRGLREQPAVNRRAGLHGNLCLVENDTLETRCSSHGHLAGDLPEYILRSGATAQRDGFAAGDVQILRNLENPDIVWATLQNDVRRYADITGPLVDARMNDKAANIPRAELSDVRCPSGCVRVCGLHVADSFAKYQRVSDVARSGA